MKNDALVLPQPLSYYIQQGLTTQALVTNLQNLGVKFETPAQGGLPSSGFYGSWANILPRAGFAWTPSFGPKGMVIRGGYGEYIYPVPVRNSVRYLTADYPFTASYSQSYTSASQAPDGLPNYLLRAPQTVVAGLNSQNVVNSNSVNALLPGISLGETLNAKYPPAHVREANFTIEQPFRDGSVVPRHLRLYSRLQPGPELSIQQRSVHLRLGNGHRNHAAHRNLRFHCDPALRSDHLGRQRDLDENGLVQR